MVENDRNLMLTPEVMVAMVTFLSGLYVKFPLSAKLRDDRDRHGMV